MRSKLVPALAAGALLLGACGDDSDDSDDPATGAADDETTEEDAPADGGDGEGAGDGGELVGVTDSELGDILVDGEGYTLYGFTPDTDGESTCYDECAETWPPLTVEGESIDEEALADELDAGTFDVTERDDGTFQVVAGDWPLYTFASDQAPGDVNGQGVEDIWYVVTPDGELIQE